MHNPFYATLKNGANLYPFEVLRVTGESALMREMTSEKLMPFLVEGKQRWSIKANLKSVKVEAKWVNDNWYLNDKIVVMGKCIRYSSGEK